MDKDLTESLPPTPGDLGSSATVKEQESPIPLPPAPPTLEKMEEIKTSQGIKSSTPRTPNAKEAAVSRVTTRTSSGARAKVSFKDVHSGGGVRTRSSPSLLTNPDRCIPSAIKKPKKRTFPKKTGVAKWGSKSKKSKKQLTDSDSYQEATEELVDQPIATAVESKDNTQDLPTEEDNSMPMDLDKHITLAETEIESTLTDILNNTECLRAPPVLEKMVFADPLPTAAFFSPSISIITKVACAASPKAEGQGRQLSSSPLKSLISETTPTVKPIDPLCEVVSNEKLDGEDEDEDVLLPSQKEFGNRSDESVIGGCQRLSPVLSSSAAGSCSEADAETAKPKRKKAKGRNGNIYIGVSNRIEWFKLQEKFGFENVNNFGNFVMAYMQKVFSDFDILHKVTLETGMFEDHGLKGFRWVNGLAHPVGATGEFLTLPEVQMDENMSQKAFQMAFDLAVERSAFLVELSNQVSQHPTSIAEISVLPDALPEKETPEGKECLDGVEGASDPRHPEILPEGGEEEP